MASAGWSIHIRNQDSSINGPDAPATQGSTVVLYATGAGQTNPPGIDGQLAVDPLPQPLAQPVSVQIGGQNAPVQSASATPGTIAGILQVTCVVPQGITPGPAVPVFLTIGTATSPAGVTMAVQ